MPPASEPQRPIPIAPLADPGKAAKGMGKLGVTGLAAVLAILGGLYAREGGYVNDPADRGGETNYGVTKQVARAAGYNGPMREFLKHCVKPEDVCADEIYFERYIEGPGFVPMLIADPAVADELVDTAANMGPVWPSRWLQQSLSEMGEPVTADGKVGSRTVTAYIHLQQRMGAKSACVSILTRLDAKQEARYRQIAARNPSQRKYLKGWINNRVGNVDRKQCGKSL